MIFKRISVLLIFILCFSTSLLAQVKLPKLISDGMVLQRDSRVKIWGWSSKNEKISLHFNGSEYETVADNSGNWEIMLPDLKAGGPYTMEFRASNTVTVNDVLIGDVWVCSGQSNMELPMRRVRPLYESEIEKANNNFIRYFEVPKKYDFNEPKKDLESGNWQKVTPATVQNFSAAAYFFAKDLYEKYQIPMGLINSSLGGSPVEAWISEESLKKFPEHYQEAQRFKDDELIKEIESKDRARAQKWYRELARKDEGHKGEVSWKEPGLNTSDWNTMKIPGYWADTQLGPVNGVVWFRKEFSIPSGLTGKTAKLNLGRIVDADSVFINGKFIGSTGYQYPPRWYDIPEGVLAEGKNIIAVRIVSERGNGGFVLDKPYELTVDGKTISLKEDWKYKLGGRMEPLAGSTFIRWKPVGLYNAMISPLLNYKIKGVIWYQGESNADRPIEYRELFPSMIKDWRDKWDQGDFPFLFVQLTNFMEAKDQPSESNWALLREAQLQTLSLPNTAMAVTIDIGEWNDIHPLRKKEVGERLALAAQKIACDDENVVHSGPIYESMKIKGNKIILSFKNTSSGLMAKGGELQQFAIAGKDKQFAWAKAKIDGNKVIVWSEKIDNPIAVRYAWADNPDNANLYNEEGLPASPFRTDSF